MSKSNSHPQTMDELPKAYTPTDVEDKWTRYWEENRLFDASPDSSKDPFCVVMPPPNITGILHMGHALVSTLQDVLSRWKRMTGYEVLWLPGTDHAGISTQTVVERHLINTENRRRTDYSREEFLDRIWQWKKQNEEKIISQIKKMGCSCDWSKQCFTMDSQNNSAVRSAFKKLYDQGLIYRGDYMVNWDPITQTALADDEVEYEEKEGHLWYFSYPFKDGSGSVTIATTRPETMLGDTAVAVSPKDKRYASLAGKTILLPLTDREIPLILDDHVDPEFGTGVVKVTPAHDPNDHEIGTRHQLAFINIMTPDGKINANGGEFHGLSMKEAREEVVKAMKAKGLLVKIEPHIHRVGVSYRSKAVIEPYISKQWFIRMDDFGKKLHSAVSEGKTVLIPKHFEKTYFHWINNLRDWCISRQLWWGHRIPIWYKKSDKDQLICYDGEGVPPEVESAPDDWIQDPDVLDTWFSSALWPFSTLGWPSKTPLFEKFYPNSILITGHDILFFWVARMLCMGEYLTGQLPFPKVFLHGLIYGKSYWREHKDGSIEYLGRTEKAEYDQGKALPKDVKSRWEKMSKSKGNVIDPFEVIEKYGADAMRMALCSTPSQLGQIDLDERRFEEFKNFANKVWNGARFVLMNLSGANPLTSSSFSQGINPSLLTLEDRWILSSLSKTVSEVNQHLNAYVFDQAAMTAYNFFWNEFCAYYVEMVKPVLFGHHGTEELRSNKQKILAIVLLQSVRLLHPFTPFITEELFQILKDHYASSKPQEGCDPLTSEALMALQSACCATTHYPTTQFDSDSHKEIEEQFESIQKIIYSTRKIRGEMKIPPSMKTALFLVHPPDSPQLPLLREGLPIIKALVPIDELSLESTEPATHLASSAVVNGIKVVVPLPENMREQELTRLDKEKNQAEKSIAALESMLENPQFIEKAPESLIKTKKEQLRQSETALDHINQRLSELSGNGGQIKR